MARPRRVGLKVVAKARAMLAQASDLEELRCAQAVLLPALLGATLEQTAALLGVGRASVPRLHTRLRLRGVKPAAPPRGWGGRRREGLSLEDERRFLVPWSEASKAGGVLVVSPIRAALAQKLGHPAAASVVYRMLARQGWRTNSRRL